MLLRRRRRRMVHRNRRENQRRRCSGRREKEEEEKEEEQIQGRCAGRRGVGAGCDDRSKGSREAGWERKGFFVPSEKVKRAGKYVCVRDSCCPLIDSIGCFQILWEKNHLELLQTPKRLFQNKRKCAMGP